MVESSMYPAAPATMHPIANPTIMLIFFRNGDPNISVKIMLTKDRNPRPINSGDPHNKGRGAKVVGQSAKIPEVGKFWQPLDPPPQFGAPDDPTSDAPIKRTMVPAMALSYRVKGRKICSGLPVIIGGKSFFKVRGGTKAKNISRKEQIKDVPGTNYMNKAASVINDFVSEFIPRSFP